MTKIGKFLGILCQVQSPVSQKSRELCGPEKPFVKLRSAYSVKLVFSYVVKGIKTKITAKFRASRRLRFEDTKRIMSPEIRPKSFGTFEKQAPEPFGMRDGGILSRNQEPRITDIQRVETKKYERMQYGFSEMVIAFERK